MTKLRYTALLATLILILCHTRAGAQTVTMTADVPPQAEVGDQIRVSFVVNSQNVSSFTAPDFRGFEVLYGPTTSRQTSVSIINGKRTDSSSIRFTFIISASKAGTYTIESATIRHNGRTVKSAPARIQILSLGAGSSQSQGSPSAAQQRQQRQRASSPSEQTSGHISGSDLFITATASRTNVHEQEAILLTYKIYTLVNLTQLDGKVPTLDGFQVQEVPLPRNKEFRLETYNGRNYRTVVWSQYVLFPQKSGRLTIPAVTFEGIVVQANPNIDPIDAFFNGGTTNEVRKKIVAPAVVINVQPLADKPADFSGAVGQFTLSSTVSPAQIKTNEALSLRVTVSGCGNMKLINAPHIALPEDFEAYDPKVTDNFAISTEGLRGTKTFEYLAVPRTAGTYTLPSVRLTYFDTATRQYKTLSTEPKTVTVAQGRGGSGASVSAYSYQRDIDQLNRDIRYIKSGDAPLRPAGQASPFTLRYALAYLLPLLLAVAVLIVGRRRVVANADVSGMRQRRANKAARRRLRTAAKMMKARRSNEFYDEVLRALYGYAADKLSIPQEHLNKENVEQQFLARGVEREMIDDFLAATAECEFARYAPGTPETNMETVYRRAFDTITRLKV